MPVRTRNAATRPMPCVSSATLRRGESLQKVIRPTPTTARPSPWPRISACARSRPTATWALAPLYGQTGQSEQACVELSTAIDMYRAMDMTFWLPQAEAALARVEGR
jgi:hypothetical protein